MPLKLSLKPGEKFVLNVQRRARPAVFEGDVEVHPEEDALPRQVQLIDAELWQATGTSTCTG